MRTTLGQALFGDRDKHYTTSSLIKVPPLKIREVHYTFFTDPTLVINESKG